jgi:hypothetical protein
VVLPGSSDLLTVRLSAACRAIHPGMEGPKQDARWWRRRASLLADLTRHDARRAARTRRAISDPLPIPPPRREPR